MPIRFAVDHVRLQADIAWAGLEWASQLLSGPLLDAHVPAGDGGTAVLTLPGFAGPEMSLSPLNRFLRRHGYLAEGWGQGVNRGPRSPAYLARLREVLGRRVQAAADRTGRKVALIGQSLGGVYARELARAHPDLVDRVITLGSPAYLSPERPDDMNRAVALVARLMTGRRTRDHLNDPELDVIATEPPGVPLVALYSAHDAVVPPQAAAIPARQTRTRGPARENIQVLGSHCGMGVSPVSLLAVMDRLQAPRDRWRPFDPTRVLPPALTPFAGWLYPGSAALQ